MGDLNLRLPETLKKTPTASRRKLIGRLLVNKGKIGSDDLKHALKLQSRIDAPLGDIMVSEGLVSRQDVLSALAEQIRAGKASEPTDRDISASLPADTCLKFGVVPWQRDKRGTHIAISSPEDFQRLKTHIGQRGNRLLPVIVEETRIQEQQSLLYGSELAAKAVTRVAEHESCRSWLTTTRRRTALALVICSVLACSVALEPSWTITVGVIVAALTLFMTTTLKAAALLSGLRLPKRRSGTSTPIPFRLPRVSILVPLLKEREIAAQLIARLSQLTYPKSLLNVVLVLEEGDSLTRETIARTHLPDWMSVIQVPDVGELTTKPRALNYALDFCRGKIVGVWDAEDWPEPDQIEKVVTRFNQAPPDVVCLQGMLDYYNSRANWLTRCFTIEYATWWRIIMPGIARLGLVVPLGGTTLFFKREVLEELGGWDAHNVTEDADLGVRLARHGFRTELLPTVTREEATSTIWGWVRQRSRWLKGFLITYFVHMRQPLLLFRTLGFWRFMGVQVLFLASVLQFAMAPLLWSFWLTLAGLPHPVEETLGTGALWGLATLFIAAEALNAIMACLSVSATGKRHLLAYVPTMMAYFALGTVASYKAIWELVRIPFFWDKTQHGVSQMTDPASPPK